VAAARRNFGYVARFRCVARVTTRGRSARS